MNQHIYRLYQTNFYPILRAIPPLFIILYLPIAYQIQAPNQWGLGASLFIIIISFLGYSALGDIYKYRLKWFIFDSSLFLVFYFYLWSLLQ